MAFRTGRFKGVRKIYFAAAQRRAANPVYSTLMPDVIVEQLQQAVETRHGGTATFVQAVPVHETHNGETVWDGVVHIFDLKGHPDGAWRAYAWAAAEDDGTRQFFAVLHTPQIKGPREAVAAAIVAKHEARTK